MLINALEETESHFYDLFERFSVVWKKSWLMSILILGTFFFVHRRVVNEHFNTLELLLPCTNCRPYLVYTQVSIRSHRYTF